MKILLPICGNDDAKLIVDFVSNFHWPPHACFKLIHVLGSSETEAQALEAEGRATILLTNLVERLTAALPDTSAIFEVLSGAAIYEIIDLASNWQADMIVMGSRTREDIESSFTGSIAKGVVMQASCSVVIIKSPQCAAKTAEQEVEVAAPAGTY